MKVRKMLLREGIKSELVKVVKNGCYHAIKIQRDDFYNAIRVMRENKINYSVYK